MMTKLFVAMAISAAVASTALAAVKDRMVFPASNGDVVFFHGNHVNEASGTCSVCHERSPEGKIDGFGADFAHKLCVSCHSDPGGAEGPTACDGCHKN
jgi:hypothetical protein